MPQYDVYRNRNPATRAAIPFLLDIQSDLLDALATRVVVPLAHQPADAAPAIARLMPEFEVEGRRVVLVTPQLAGVSRTVLGARVASLAEHRHTIVAALDVLVTGV